MQYNKHTDKLVSLYFTLISDAVRRIASIASSRVTRYIPSLAIDNWAAVTALTAPRLLRSCVGIRIPDVNYIS